MEFKLSERQIQLIREWQNTHTQIYTGPSCERYTYMFTPGGLGMFVEVKDFVTGELLDVSEI